MALDIGSGRCKIAFVDAAGKPNLIANIRRYTGVETPRHHDDAQLVPGFPATDRAIRSAQRQVH